MDLIERAGVLQLLQNELDSVSKGEGHCVFVSGEAGIGKTSLIKTFCRQQENKCTIYQGACDALFTPRPLAPVYDIIWQVRSDLWPNSHTIEERSELFLKLFHEIKNNKGKVLIVFDDIHWADEATLDFIKFFARRISQLQCLFILTYRDNEINAGHALSNVLGSLSPEIFTRVQLQPLSKQAVYKLAEEKGFDAKNVYNISGGNPFYVTEILASYSPGVPDNIKDAILAVYNRQEDGTKNAWEICSVIPEGLEINRFAKLKSSWEGMDRCFALKIIIIKNERVIFKHELYRRTIEGSLSPFKRIALNKRMLELFLDSFEEEGDIERIVHYAKNANENKIVVKYAPVAAKQAASVGAHIEASKLFLTAIEYSEGNDYDQLVKFYEAYAYESYLTSQIKEAIIYQGKALKIWQLKNETDQIGNSQRFLSRLWWFDGNREKAEAYARQAIETLNMQPSSKIKAMAFSNMSQLKMFSEETAECVEWGNLAINMAREIHDDETLCHALSNVGFSQWRVEPTSEIGKSLLMEGLNVALKNSFDEHAGRAYSSIISNYITFKQFPLAKKFLSEGIAYCDERDLDSSKNYKLCQKARMLLETGEWTGACLIAKTLLENSNQPIIIKINALPTLATVEIRKGDPAALAHLQEAKTHAFPTEEHHQIIPVVIAFFEYEWLNSKKLITDDEIKFCLYLIQKVDNIFLNSEFDFWLKKARKQQTRLSSLYEPYQLLKAGKQKAAANFWDKIGCPFEKALALSEGSEEDKKNALLILQQLGADAVYDKTKMGMRAEGIKKIPRGIRESTKNNPAQLTHRELDVLQLLYKGMQNKEIANTLFISPKTADNHISNILFKLDVNSRAKAVSEAVRLGIVK